MMRGVSVGISRGRISVEDVLESVSSKKAGGTVLFLGTVRNKSGAMRVDSLELESAADLALSDLERIAATAMRRFDILKIAISHRTGRITVGRIIVAIAVSAPHRKDAFAACKFIIDEVKKTTPIWKKELGPAGQRWVKSER